MMPSPQDPIALAIQRMLEKRPRRKQLAREQPDLLRPPAAPYKDWYVRFPFPETLWKSFETMCCDVRSIGLKENGKGDYYTYLKDVDERALEQVRHWQETVGRYVAIRDGLALSFALDYTLEGGAPANPHTRVSALRLRAKPYDGSPTEDTFVAADQLIEECLSFLRSMTCYAPADTVIAMPASSPGKPFDLPRYIARGIGKAWKRNDLSDTVATVRPRPQLKEVLLEEKLAALRDTIAIESGALEGRTVLLVDDLYQSGVSMNYVAMELQGAGVREVFGLACEKTCRNDDNLSRSNG
jgi:hypothetical protein